MITSIFPATPQPPYRDHPPQHGPSPLPIRIARVKLTEDWYACSSAPADVVQWWPQSATDKYDPGLVTAATSRHVVCRDPAGMIEWDLAAAQADDGRWYIPEGWYCTVWQPEDAIDGHWELLHAGQPCQGDSGSEGSGSGSGGSGGSGSGGSGSGSAGSGSGVCITPAEKRLGGIPGYDQGHKQALCHDDQGCLFWMDIDPCP